MLMISPDHTMATDAQLRTHSLDLLAHANSDGSRATSQQRNKVVLDVYANQISGLSDIRSGRLNQRRSMPRAECTAPAY